MATLIKTRDHRSIKNDCAYIETHPGFKDEKRWVCTCIYKLRPENCTGCVEYESGPSSLAKFAEQAELFENQVLQYQLSAAVRDEAEDERTKVSEWLVEFLSNVPRDGKGKIKLETAHHSVLLVEPTASRAYNLEKVRTLFDKIGAKVIRRRISVDIDVPDGITKEMVVKALSSALKKLDGALTFVATDPHQEVSQDAIDGALKLDLVTAEDLLGVSDITPKKSYPKVSDKSEAVVREGMI